MAHHVCAAPGGFGAVREVCELILEARGILEDAIRAHR
jgi:3-deoxy-D-manno-octulosonate 8-phosphate phosphatase KdsC-like HAD superfamily phosphatase